MPDDDRTPLIEDRALRGGDVVLSPGALEGWLAESLGVPCRVTPRRLRYKAGTSAILGFDLTTERGGLISTEPCVASAFADGGAAKVEKSLLNLPPRALLAHDTARHALVTTAEGDRAVPLLPRLGQPDGHVRLLARILPEARHASEARTRTIRHNPGRRWVGTLDRVDHPTLLLRAYSGSNASVHAAACYRALSHSYALTPEVVARSRSLAVLAVTWVDGVDLRHTPDRLDLWRAAGRTLARLHDSTGRGLRHSAPDSEATAVSAAGRQIAGLLPEIADEVVDLARATARELECLPHDTLAIHGDFSPDQVVARHDGASALIDLDAAQLGSAAYDLGCLTASASIGDEASSTTARCANQLAAFVAGYEEVRRPPDPFAVAVHTVAFRLRKAVDPFRECAPTWRQQVEQRVVAARTGLDDLHVAGRRR